MKVVALGSYVIVIGVLIVACSPTCATAATIRPPSSFDVFGRPTSATSAPSMLFGTTYKLSGFNTWLPAASSPVCVKFDGVKEAVGAYSINESVRQFANDQGKQETWIDFDLQRLPSLVNPRFNHPLAKDAGAAWRINLADLQLPPGTKFDEYYLYFTDDGAPAPFNRRERRGTDQLSIGNHPYLNGVKVLRDNLLPLKDGDLPPGAQNALITKFEHYFSGVHDVARGLGVPIGVDGFHIGYRIVIPEPMSSFYAATALACSLWIRRRSTNR